MKTLRFNLKNSKLAIYLALGVMLALALLLLVIVLDGFPWLIATGILAIITLLLLIISTILQYRRAIVRARTLKERDLKQAVISDILVYMRKKIKEDLGFQELHSKAYVMGCEPLNNRFYLYAKSGKWEKHDPIWLNSVDIARRLWNIRSSVLIDWEDSQLNIRKLGNLKSTIAAPIMGDNQIIAVLFVDTKSKLDLAEFHRVETVADISTIADLIGKLIDPTNRLEFSTMQENKTSWQINPHSYFKEQDENNVPFASIPVDNTVKEASKSTIRSFRERVDDTEKLKMVDEAIAAMSLS